MAINRVNILLFKGWQAVRRFWGFITGHKVIDSDKTKKLEQARIEENRIKEETLCSKVYDTFNLPEVIEARLNKRTVPAVIIKQNAKTVWVELPDGNVVKRRKRDVVNDGFVNKVKNMPRAELKFNQIRNYVNG